MNQYVDLPRTETPITPSRTDNILSSGHGLCKRKFTFTGLTYFFDKLTLFINDGETGLTVYIKGGNGDGKYEYKNPGCR